MQTASRRRHHTHGAHDCPVSTHALPTLPQTRIPRSPSAHTNDAYLTRSHHLHGAHDRHHKDSAPTNGAYMYLTQRAFKWRIHVPHAARPQMAHTCTSRSAHTNGAYMHPRPPSRGRQGRQGREKSLHRRRPKLVQFLQRSLQIAGGRGRHLIRRHRHTDVLHGQLHGDVG